MARVIARIEGIDEKGRKVGEGVILNNAGEGIDPEGFHDELRKLSPYAKWKSLTVHPASEGEPIPANIPEWSRTGAKHLEGDKPYTTPADGQSTAATLPPSASAKEQPAPAARG